MVLSNKSFGTEKIAESNSRSGGIPLLKGGYVNESLTTIKFEDAPHLAMIKVGDIEITGVIDQGTPIDILGGWIWRMVRSIITGQVFKAGINGYFDNAAAKTAADVTNNTAKLNADTATTLAKERGKLIPKVNPELVPIEPLKSP